jgi:sugar lactone lactonase YvrE
MPSSLALDAEGNIFVADIGNGHVRRINPQGRVETLPHTFGMPTHIAFDKNGKLLVLDRSNACVYALNPNDGAQKVEIQNATLSVVVRFSELELPSHYSALTIDSNNNILLVEEGEKTVIRRIQPNGIVRVLFDKTRDIVSVADVCIMPFSQTILFTNVRDNGVYKMQISSSMKLSEESMTSVIEHEVK